MGEKLKFYYDPLSEPCRTVWMFLEITGIPYTPRLVICGKGETKTNEEFLKVSASRNVPAIDDNGFCLFESVAILKYLIEKHKPGSNWYPADLEKRARIEEYLNWHHNYTRIGAGWLVFFKYTVPTRTGKPVNEDKIAFNKDRLGKCLETFENHFLKDTKFISSDEISIADLVAVCEFTQYWGVKMDVTQDKPNMKRWMDACKESLSPHFDKVHEALYHVRDNS